MYCSLHCDKNLIGIFDNKESCKNFLNGLKNNKLLSNFDKYTIRSFHRNTINQVNELFYDNEKLDFLERKKVKVVIKKDSDEMKKKKQEIYEKKNEIEIKKFKLNIQKTKIENSKNTYKNDILLFKKFQKKIKKNNVFKIPEMFQKKFILFKKLDEENKLSWENFYIEYKHETFYNEYSNLF
tara:strand:- start:119 stop:664 length:546 start_codon:yes stop_codon:yes gene_type:complete